MGKDLKGKELGVGISQRKDGLYTARFTTKEGKRKQKYFEKLQECRNWIADAQFEDEHGNALLSDNPTVDAVYEQWIDIKRNTRKLGTVEIYERIYKCHIQKAMGSMLAKDVKPLHCQKILLEMSKEHRSSYVCECKYILQAIFGYALENDLINKNPVVKSVIAKGQIPKKEKEALSIHEQKQFLANSQDNIHYNEWAFILQTGIRAGELIALTWDDVNFKDKYVDINKTMRQAGQSWVIGEPKTKTSKRQVPLTNEAIQILKNQKQKNMQIKTVPIEFANLVFLNKKGCPTSASVYDRILKTQCAKLGINNFSMHILRHTFATRCIEAGMQPKTLQIILGHATLSMTMDLYVHVTNESKSKAINEVENALKVV